MSGFRPVVVIPVYNHEAAIGAMVAGVRRHGIDCLLVDDGSKPSCARVLDALAAGDAGVHLERLPENRGKGAAVIAGLRAAAARLDATHAVQIDADGQHEAADVPAFLAIAASNPDAIVCGAPIYDASVPKGRLYSRYLTHVWVWIHTLSFDIRDSMCGFRVYPLASILPLLNAEPVGLRMDFDPEIVVRAHWRGIPVLNRETRVTYPSDGVSHFDVVRDNVRISKMHAGLFFGMLWRLPRLLWRKVGG